MSSDLELLESFAHNGDEHAFASLVTRHLNLVYSAAMRQVSGNVHSAQDVAQKVFLSLATKSASVLPGLRNGQPLVGWLYTTALFAASHVRRAERRQQQREHEAQLMNQTLDSQTAAPEPPWSEMRLVLDEAMRELKALDRDAILLRYFQGLEFRSVGVELGVTEEAARKRIDRALDRLQIWFKNRGIRTTVAALAAGLATHAIQQAPSELAGAVTKFSITGATTAATGTGMAWVLHSPLTTGARLAIGAGAALLLVGAIAFVANRNSTGNDTHLGGGEVTNVPTDAPAPLPVATATTAASSDVAEEEPESYLRVPKSFLERIPMPAVTASNPETRDYTLSTEFIETLRITPLEVQKVHATLAEALHQYRTEEGRHLEPSTEKAYDPFPPRTDTRVLEAIDFILMPFPDEAQAIRAKLEADVLEAIGPERTKLFFKSFSGGMKTFSEAPSPQIGKTKQYYSFRLREWPTHQEVDLHQASVSERGGAGAGGGPYPASLDPYLPESLKPTIVQWRQRIAEFAATVKREPLAEVAPDAAAPSGSTAVSRDRQQQSTPWDESASHIDLRKSLLRSVGFAAIAPDGKLTDDARVLCEMTDSEVNAVQNLYAALNERCLKLEIENFEPIPSEKGKYLIRAFPEANAELCREWTKQLKELLGKERAEFLDQMIRTMPSVHARMSMSMRGIDRIRAGINWVEAGTNVVVMELVASNIRGQSIEVRYGPKEGSGPTGTFGIREDRVPNRWRHLLTPEVLNAQ